MAGHAVKTGRLQQDRNGAAKQSDAANAAKINGIFSKYGLNQTTAIDIFNGQSVKGFNPANAREAKKALVEAGWAPPTNQ